MGRNATNQEVPKEVCGENGEQEEPCDVNVVFHGPALLSVGAQMSAYPECIR